MMMTNLLNSASPGQEKKTSQWDRSFENQNILCMIPEISVASSLDQQEVGNFSEQNRQQDEIISMFEDGKDIKHDSPRVFLFIYTVLKTISLANKHVMINSSG